MGDKVGSSGGPKELSTFGKLDAKTEYYRDFSVDTWRRS